MRVRVRVVAPLLVRHRQWVVTDKESRTNELYGKKMQKLINSVEGTIINEMGLHLRSQACTRQQQSFGAKHISF